MIEEQTRIRTTHDAPHLASGVEVTTTAVPARVRYARLTFRLLAWIFAACVVIQVFIAGLAVFADPARWAWHRAFVHTFEFLPLIMLALAFVGRLPTRIRWLIAATYGLFWVQYATAGIGGVAGAFHPVNALLLFWVAMRLARTPIHDGAFVGAQPPAARPPSLP